MRLPLPDSVAEAERPALTLAPTCGSNERRPPGVGRVEWQQVRGRTVVTTASACSPLRLLTPARNGTSSWVFGSTFGGGLLAGDVIDIAVVAREGVTALLGTQASTKIYRSADGRPATQKLQASVEREASLVVLPDPITCFADSAYVQRMRIDLHPTANLVMLDWFTSGRRAMGERWAFRKYDSRIDLSIEGKLVFRDATLLDPDDGPLAGSARLGAFNCVALAVLAGPRLASAAAAEKALVDAEPIRQQSGMLIAASPIPGGVLLRAAGPDTQTVGQWMRERLTCVSQLLGEDPWRRKF